MLQDHPSSTSPPRTNISMDDKPTSTPGEELYLIHLRRLREEEDDHDHLPRKRRACSAGEELWEVHRRRSVGMEEDYDEDMPCQDHNTTGNMKTEEKNRSPRSQKVVHDITSKCCRYNLRSRDHSIHKKA